MPQPPARPPRRLPRLAAALLALLLAAPLAPPAAAQDTGGQRLTFGIEQRLTFGRNTALANPAEGLTATSATRLSFRLQDATALERITLDGAAALILERGPAGETTVTLESPALDLSYTRAVPDALLSFGASYRRGDAADLSDSLSVTDEQTRETRLGLRLRAEILRRAPASLLAELAVDRLRYDSTTDPDLVGSDTVTFTLGSDLRLSPVLTGSLRLSRESDRTATGPDRGRVITTDRLTAALIRQMPTGSASLTLSWESGDAGTRRTVTVGRSLSLADATLDLSIGVTQADRGGTDLVGRLDLRHRLGAGDITLGLERRIERDGPSTADTTTTAASLAWQGALTDIDSLRIALDWQQDATPTDRMKETELSVTWSRRITDRAQLDAGLSWRVRQDAGGRADRPSIFLSVSQSF